MRTIAIVGVFLTVACGGGDKPGGSSGSAAVASGSAPGSAAPAAAPGVAITINGKPAATVAAKDLAAWPRLDTLVPVEVRRIGQWKTLTVLGKSGKPVTLNRPGDQYRDQALALFVADGAPAFGVFDPVELAKRGQPQLREDGLVSIAIDVDVDSGRGQNESGSGGGGDPLQIKLAIKTPKGESVLTGEKLLALPRETVPGTQDSKGWRLTTVLTAAGITAWEKVLLTDAAGLTLVVEKKDFDDKTTIPFLKLNKQATLRMKIYKRQGEGWQSTGDLRAVASIEQLK